MTGFGRALVERGPDRVQVELKSVNHRQFLWKGKLPESLRSKEPWAEERARKVLHRGTVMLNVHLSSPSLEAIPILQKAALKGLLDQLRDLMDEDGIDEGVDFFSDPSLLLTVPGIVKAEEPGEQPKLGEEFQECFDEALERLVQSREREGLELAIQIKQLCKHILSIVDHFEEGLPQSQNAFRERLQKRVQEALEAEGVSLHEGDLLREIAIYADKGDVSEEISRLRIHVQEVLLRLEKGGELGRALEFHTQELFREANTLGAKTADPHLSLQVIDLKTTIEKIREQVLNIE
jgi:uncharacterized protein (TIGR00255 family)